MTDKALDRDAWALHEAVSDLVRLYQFRDRTRICCYDITVTQCYAINVLVLHGPIQLNRLAAKLFLDKSTASRVVDSLEGSGYVRRAVDPDDGRALRLELTGSGRKLHARVEQDMVGEMKGLLADYTPDVRKATAQLVARLARAAAAGFACHSDGCGGD